MTKKQKIESSPRKTETRELYDRIAPQRDAWIDRNRFYYQDLWSYMRFLVPEGLKVLDLGCGTGRMLDAVKPAHGVGVDLSDSIIRIAKENFPAHTFHQGDIEDPALIKKLGGPFDIIIIHDVMGMVDDCEEMLLSLHPLCTPETRIIISTYSYLWEPVLKLAEMFGLKMPTNPQNWLSPGNIENMLNLTDFELFKKERRLLMPKSLFGLGHLINRFIGTLPGLRHFSLRNFIIARPMRDLEEKGLSATVVVPCRNERGNIEAAVTRTPRFCKDMEILYVEGNSSDGTWEEIQRVIAAYPQYDIKAIRQDGKGKGDAVRKAFDAARGDVLMILDADLTMPPEDLPKFYRALASGKGQFINGSRLVYPMDKQAMRFLNYCANHVFSWLFSWLLNQRFTDTLCGTKVLRKKHYEAIAHNRAYFGEFDPFGDFDLIFGAAKLNLKIIEVPIRYADRTYGETQISRFRHGLLLLRMVVFAYRKLKAF